MKTNRIIALVLAITTLLIVGCAENGKDNAPDKDDTTLVDGTNRENGGIVNTNIKLESGEAVFRGKVISVDRYEIQMEIVDSEVAFGTYRVLIQESTPYFDENGAAITKDDIKVDDVIEVVFGGLVMNSYPPQIAAKRIYLAK